MRIPSFRNQETWASGSAVTLQVNTASSFSRITQCLIFSRKNGAVPKITIKIYTFEIQNSVITIKIYNSIKIKRNSRNFFWDCLDVLLIKRNDIEVVLMLCCAVRMVLLLFSFFSCRSLDAEYFLNEHWKLK